MLRLMSLVAILFVTTLSALAPAAADKRVALVIGNGAYRAVTKLINPPNDASDISAALRRLGFDVVEGRDLSKRAMEDKIIEFSRKLDGADIALFFYAGHGMQVAGKNYLVPVDAKLERAGDLNFETLDVGLVLQQMEAEKRVNLIFLDACRDNPLARSLARTLGTRSASVGTGLASIQSAMGTMIAYATQPDNVALDGEGRNSPFTRALLKHLGTPGLEIGTLMKRVRSDVVAATREKQVPWDHSSLMGDVILAPAVPTVAAPLAPPVPASDETAWSFVKDTKDPNQLRRFIERFPTSSRHSEAAAQLLTLEKQNVAVVTQPAKPATLPEHQVAVVPPPTLPAEALPLTGSYGSLTFEGTFVSANVGPTTVYDIKTLNIRFVPNAPFNRTTSTTLKSLNVVAGKIEIENGKKKYNILFEDSRAITVKKLDASSPFASIGSIQFRIPKSIVDKADYVGLHVTDGRMAWPFGYVKGGLF